MAILSRHSLIGFLADEFGKSYYKDSSGAIALDNLPRRIRHLPDGWIDFTLKFSRNNKYLGIDRTGADEVKFVKDGLDILRHLQYTGRGSQEKVYFLLYELDLVTGVYTNYDRMLVDMSQWQNEDTGVKTKLIQGGPAYYIKANENTTYEIEFGNEQILDDGIELDDTFNYSYTPYDLFVAGDQQIGLSFLNNEGDNVGVTKGGQSAIGDAQTVNSYNNHFASITPVTARIVGSITVAPKDSAIIPHFRLYATTNLASPGPLPNSTRRAVALVGGTTSFDSSGNPIFSPNDSAPVQTQTTFSFDASFDLQANERLFQIAFNQSEDHPVTIISGDFKVIFQSRNAVYVRSAMRPLDLFQKLMDNVTGNRYKVRSIYLEQNSDDYWDSGDAVRGIDGVKIKLSLSDFFSFYFARGCALGIDETDPNNPVVWLEGQEYTFDNTTEIVNIGEVANFVDSINTDRLFSSIKAGSKDQTYSERAGRFEVNSETERSTPVTTQQKELDLIPVPRTDPYGMSFLRSDYLLQPTTDSGGDNDVFVTNVVDSSEYVNAVLSIGNDSTITWISALPVNIIAGAKFQLINTVNGNKGIFSVKSLSGNTATVNEPTNTEAAGNAMVLYYARPLNRNYNPVTGVPPSYFNYKYTPVRSVMATQGYWGGGLLQLPNEYVIFNSGKKNTAVTIGSITENANIPIGTITSYWRNIDFTFDTRIPKNIVPLLRAKRGYITFTCNGFPLQGFVDDITIKPALNPSQSWKLICSSLVNPADLEFIRNAPFYKILGGMYSKRNPFHIVKANASYPSQYHFKNMDSDWHQNRTQRFADRRRYFQPWQLDDTTSFQIITEQASVNVTIRDCKGRLIDMVTVTQKTDPFVTAPFTLFEALVNFLNCKHGEIYCLQSIIGTGSTAVTYLSEPFVTARHWNNTLLIDYRNSTNKPDMVFSTGFSPRLRVQGGVYDTAGKFRNSTFEDEPADFYNLDGVEHDELSIEFTEVPDWMESKINRIVGECDTVLYDGNLLSMASDSFERNKDNPNSPLTSLRATMRPTENYPAIPLDGSGLNGAGFFTTYNIRTRAFTAMDAPNADQTDDIIQITEVD